MTSHGRSFSLPKSLLHLAWLGLLSAPTASAESFEKTLTKTDQNIHVAVWEGKGSAVTPDCPTPWSVRKQTLHGGRQEGVDVILVDNGKLHFTVIPTRGMGILSVHQGDVRLGWDSPVKEIVHPQFVNQHGRGGLGWLEGFNEWMCRCGLESFGEPGPDKIKNEDGQDETVDLTLHGKIANRPASYVSVHVDRQPPYRIHILGRVDEKMLYGPKFELFTDISTEPGSSSLRIADVVKNAGGQPQEFEVLYHGNYGKGLLEAGATFVGPVKSVFGADVNSAKTVKRYTEFVGPTNGYVAPVYCFQLYGDASSRTAIMLQNKAKDRAVSMAYSLKEIPYLTIWKHLTAEADGYVTGIEPGTNYPFHRSVERKAGRVIKLAPGAAHAMTIDFTIHATKEDVGKVAAIIQAIQGERPTTIDEKPFKAD